MDEWFYKAFGEEHGPVSFGRLQEMALKNQLSPQDQVRTAEWKEFVAARTVPQLFPKHRLEDEAHAAEEIDDLDFASIELSDGNKESELSSLDDLDIQVSDAPTAAKVSGPVDAYGSVIEEQHSPRESEFASLDDLDIQISNAPSAGQSSGSMGAYGAPITKTVEAQYICLALGHELGPMPFEDLRMMARKGELGLDDDVRREDETEWRPARTVDGLFPGFQYMPAPESDAAVRIPASEVPAAPPVEAPPPKPQTAGSNGRSAAKPAEKHPEKPAARKRAKKKRAAKEKKEDLQKWLSDEVPSAPEIPAEPEPQPEPASPPAEEAAPAPAADTPNPAAAYQARMAELARQQSVAKTPAAKAKVQGPSMGERISGLGEKLKGNPIALGIFVVLALVLIVKYVPWPFGAGNQVFFDEITTIGSGVKELRTKNAGQSQIDTYKRQVMPRLDALEQELKDAGAGSKDRPKQEMLWAVGNLKTILEGGKLPKEPTQTEKLYDSQMATAKDLMEGKTPQPPPPATPASNEP